MWLNPFLITKMLWIKKCNLGLRSQSNRGAKNEKFWKYCTSLCSGGKVYFHLIHWCNKSPMLWTFEFTWSILQFYYDYYYFVGSSNIIIHHHNCNRNGTYMNKLDLKRSYVGSCKLIVAKERLEIIERVCRKLKDPPRQRVQAWVINTADKRNEHSPICCIVI